MFNFILFFCDLAKVAIIKEDLAKFGYVQI
jgi:hypothetical protein